MKQLGIRLMPQTPDRMFFQLMLFTTILASFSAVTALPNSTGSYTNTGVCKDIKAGVKCRAVNFERLYNTFMPVASSDPKALQYNFCKCIRSIYSATPEPKTLKFGMICIKPDVPIQLTKMDVTIVSDAVLGQVGAEGESAKPTMQIIQAWEETVTIKNADGVGQEIKRYSQVLFAVPNTMERERQLVELLSDTPEISPELFAEAAQAAKDFGLKSDLKKVNPNSCTV